MPPIRGQHLKLLAAVLNFFSCVLVLKVWDIVPDTVS